MSALAPGMTVTLMPSELAFWPHHGPPMTVTLTDVGRVGTDSDGLWIGWTTSTGEQVRNQYLFARHIPAILARSGDETPRADPPMEGR